jgi:lipooligosaccharide transport system permease protein
MITATAAAQTVMLRNWFVFRRGWWVFLTGFLEPVFYLFSIGVGVGKLVSGFEVGGELIPYAAFVAPAMLATSAMNGAIYDSTFNVFFKLKFEKVYDTMLATPLRPRDVANGELAWCLVRSGVYSAGFLVVMSLMGMVSSWWAVLALPATLLIGFAFAAVGMACTTYMRSWQDFEFVNITVMPMFLFSATFFPLSAYPAWLEWVVQATPLYRGVVLCRELTTGALTWESPVSVVYFVVMGLLGLRVVGRRLSALLLT